VGHRFMELAFTPSVVAAQEAQGSRQAYEGFDAGPAFNNALDSNEVGFILERDSFYMATVGETSWPYIQHRGGPPGFLQPVDAQTLVFPDYRGNRQYISLGNVGAGPKACLFLMDYERKARLKILGLASVSQERPDGYVDVTDDVRRRVERYWTVKIEGFDWNCPQHITRRFSEQRVRELIKALSDRVEDLESGAQS
jgi:predicted pyridoxine 5'-phosphate oxidase superfamily flavin-nucleotide-binding protein